MKRNEFVKKTGAAALLMSMGVLLNSCNDESDDISVDDSNDDDSSEKVTLSLSQNPFDTLQNVDGWLLHPEENILLVNVDGNIRAFTSVCTHSGCSDNWEYGSAQFKCTCHGSLFNNKGEVVKGPAATNLREFSVSVENGSVEITL
jgi:Rieske Fe-S protein